MTDIEVLKDQCVKGEVCAICGKPLAPKDEKIKFLRPMSGSNLFYFHCLDPSCQQAVKKFPNWAHLQKIGGPLHCILREVTAKTSIF